MVRGCNDQGITSLNAINKLRESPIDFQKVLFYSIATNAFYMGHAVEHRPIGINIFVLLAAFNNVPCKIKTLGQGFVRFYVCLATVGKAIIRKCNCIWSHDKTIPVE